MKLINYNSRSFLLSDEFLFLRGRFYFIKEIKKTCSSCIVELYKHLGIFKQVGTHVNDLGPVHTYPDIFESATFSFRIRKYPRPHVM